MTAVLGASLGVSGIRAVSVDLSVDPPQSTDTFLDIPEGSDDPWGAVTWAVHRLAREQGACSTAPVLALRDKNPAEAYGVEQSGGLALVTDLGAQIGALQEIGDIAGEHTVAVFDVGAGGVSMSIVDVATGTVHSSRRSTVLSGDGCDAALSSFVLEHYGRRAALTDDARDLLVETVCDAKERLSSLTAVEISGPFRSGNATLHRSELDDLIRESVFDAVTMAAAVIESGPRVDALYAVGGGANMQIVRQSLIDALPVPVFVPREPELLAARGAAGMARKAATAASAVGVAGRPRHSDTSSRRLTRLRGSRYLGGAVAALVAGTVAVTIAAASSRHEVPNVEYTQVITSTRAVPTTVESAAAVSSSPVSAVVTTDSPTTNPNAQTSETASAGTSEDASEATTTTDRRRPAASRIEPTTTEPTTMAPTKDSRPRDESSAPQPASPAPGTTTSSPPQPSTTKPSTTRPPTTTTRATTRSVSIPEILAPFLPDRPRR